MTTTSAEALQPGDRLGKFSIRQTLGVGGMGIVYRARDTVLQRSVAIKVLNVSEEKGDGIKRFMREALAISAVEHPNVVRILEYGFEGRPFIVMEYLRGEDLVAVLRRGNLDLARAVDIILGVCAGVFACHRRGIVHRDLKPANIFIHQSEVGEVVKVLDFGVSRIQAPSDLTGDGVLIGTLRYMSPEQAAGQVADAKSDQYAIGLLLYALLTGRHPFHRLKGNPLLIAIAKGEVDRPKLHRSELPDELDEIVATAMHLDPARRFPSLLELGRQLLPFASEKKRLRCSEYLESSGEPAMGDQPSAIAMDPMLQPASQPTSQPMPIITEIGSSIGRAPTVMDPHLGGTLREEDRVTVVDLGASPGPEAFPSVVQSPVQSAVPVAVMQPTLVSAPTFVVQRPAPDRRRWGAAIIGIAISALVATAVIVSIAADPPVDPKDHARPAAAPDGGIPTRASAPRLQEIRSNGPGRPDGPDGRDGPGGPSTSISPVQPEYFTGEPPLPNTAVTNSSATFANLVSTTAPAQQLPPATEGTVVNRSKATSRPSPKRKSRRWAYTEDGSPILN